MLLRPYQQEFVNQCIENLDKDLPTLGTAATGAGKTIMLSAIANFFLDRFKKYPYKVLILAHRNELTFQNRDKFLKSYPHILTSLYNYQEKDFSGQVVFAMVQTLCLKKHLDKLPPIDLLIIDEAHHASTVSYQKIIKYTKELNPDLKLLGVTATPHRNDKSLKKVFPKINSNISIKKLIRENYLVKPACYIINIDEETTSELNDIDESADYMDIVAEILTRDKSLNEIIRHWKDKAHNRKTVIFCSTIMQAQIVTQKFIDSGISAACISSDLSIYERNEILTGVTEGEIQVLVNVAILTEGWDFPPISCVMLLRKESNKSAYIQMMGRGLRIVNMSEYPEIIKKDCLMLDFGFSSLKYKDLFNVTDDQNNKGYENDFKCIVCLSYTAVIKYEVYNKFFDSIEEARYDFPHADIIRAKVCSSCGHIQYSKTEEQKSSSDNENNEREKLDSFDMRELSFFPKLKIFWTEITYEEWKLGIERIFTASGFSTWVVIIKIEDNYLTIDNNLNFLFKGTLEQAFIIGEDYLLMNEQENNIKATAHWKSMPPTDKQLNFLPDSIKNSDINKGIANNYLTYKFKIKDKLCGLIKNS